MAAAPPPLVGFNDNLRYRGLRFHVQTEDSGVKRPHVVTHLFADGGHIIKSIRREYSEHVDSPERESTVRRMMTEQHKAMAVALRRGRLDSTVDSLPGIESRPIRSAPGPETREIPSLSALTPSASSSQGPATLPSSAAHQAVREVSASVASISHHQKPVGRPSPKMLHASTSHSLFGTTPQTSLDNAILGYLSAIPKRATGKDK